MPRAILALVPLALLSFASARAVGEDRTLIREVLVGGPSLLKAKAEGESKQEKKVEDAKDDLIPLAEFDHGVWDRLLARYVDHAGRVCYRDWKACDPDRLALLAYLQNLGRVRIKPEEKSPFEKKKDEDEKPSRAAEKALYLNAYNALVIHGILREYPTPSIQLHNRDGAEYRIFDDLKVWLDGGYLSLNDIENDRLRPMGDFRIHFGLVCASRSCPPLAPIAFTAENVDDLLENRGFAFLHRRDAFRVRRHKGVVMLTPIAKWFREDFGSFDAEILANLSAFVPPEDALWLYEHPCARIEYLGYDWGLNDQCPTPLVAVGRSPFHVFSKLQPILNRFAGDAAALEPEPVAEPQPEEKKDAAQPAPSKPKADDAEADADAPPPPEPLMLDFGDEEESDEDA